MIRHNLSSMLAIMFILVMVSLACSTSAVQPTPTSRPQPTSTETPIPTDTPLPSPTPRPSRTPDAAATQHVEQRNAEAQKYFDLGYLNTTEGRFVEYQDFTEEWAQLGWYSWWTLNDRPRDFYLKAHLKWSSAYRNADLSGCGFVFATQSNDDHYAVFLDRSQVYFLETGRYYTAVGPTRGTGRVAFDNPADHSVEADLTLIVTGAYAYVLVDEEVIGEYTLAQSKNVQGNLGLALLSGTNRDYGTRCEMTDLHAWIAKP